MQVSDREKFEKMLAVGGSLVSDPGSRKCWLCEGHKGCEFLTEVREMLGVKGSLVSDLSLKKGWMCVDSSLPYITREGTFFYIYLSEKITCNFPNSRDTQSL